MAQLGLDLGPEGLLAGYRPLPGIRDEAVDPRGVPRPHWAPVVGAFAEAGPEVTARGFAAADRHLAELGVSYRIYGEAAGTERPWPLSNPPFVITAAEFGLLARALVQRAELMEAVLSDLYGAARLVTEGLLPARLVADSREFLRPLVGARPAGGRFLKIFGFDVVRRADGGFAVASDRAQAPSGIGYAVENRTALARALPEVLALLGVEPVAPFREEIRAALARLARRDEARIAVLTPGPLNETYFEHAYLARALGFLLVEGADLTVAADALHVRTVEGLKRIDVVLRRLDGDFADPLALNGASRLGVPGLVRAARSGAVAIANALGSGLVETPGLARFLPALARRLLGEDLLLPSTRTYWSGVAADRAAALDDLPRLSVDGSQVGGAGWTSVRDLEPAGRRALEARLATGLVPMALREAPSGATTPVFENGTLVPRPFALRLFACHGAGGWTVMPGGLCRIADAARQDSLSMQRGGRSADIWVVGREHRGAPQRSSEHASEQAPIAIRRAVGALPSRAADNLFWLGRYLQRAEATLRAIRLVAERAGDLEEAVPAGGPLQQLAALLALWGAAPFPAGDPLTAAEAALGGALPSAVPAILAEARRNASVIRDRLSPDAWRALLDVTAAPEASPGDDAFTRSDRTLRAIAAFGGIVEDTMNRLAGWRFLKLGWHLERAVATCRFARQLAPDSAGLRGLEALLAITDCESTYRARYLAAPALHPVLDLVLLDPANPRSVAYQVERIVEHLRALPAAPSGDLVAETDRIALRLAADLVTANIAEMGEAAMRATETALMRLSDALTARYVTPALAGMPPADALG